MSSQEPLSLDQLGETYEVIGEQSGNGATRRVIAKRRADGADVLITVAQPPSGDEGNALSHLAADVNLVSGRAHRNLLPVLEGRWLDTDAFAIVTERVNDPSLEELLARRDEEFDFPRIATILGEVNGLLEWARSQKVVHRAIDADSVYIEPGSDRVRVSFAVRPLLRADMPGAEDDARTIALLARAMMTRSSAAPERDAVPLAELRPGLPTKVIKQTEALLTPSAPSPRRPRAPDVRGYIAAVATADILKRAESECSEKVEKMRQDERAAREKIEAARQEWERIAAERERALESEREVFLKETKAIQKALNEEREALDEERAALAQLNDALKAQQEAHARAEELVTHVGEHVPVAMPPRATQKRPTLSRHSHRPRTSAKRRNWKVPVTASVLLLLVTISLFALGRRNWPKQPTNEGGVSVSRVEEAAGGVAVGSTDTVIPVPAIPGDFVSGVATRAATAPPSPIRVRRRPRPVPVMTDSSVLPTIRPDSTIRVDSVRATLDSLRRTRIDSMRRDSVRRDTLIRRDTLGSPF